MKMTMDRATKTQHTAELIAAATTGYTKIQFASPKLRTAAKADRGHCRMTASEYLAHRMGRGQMDASRLETNIEIRRTIRRSQRTLGSRRITGVFPGTKEPVIFRRKHNVDRGLTIR